MEAGSPPRDPFDKFFPQHQCRDSDAEADDDEASLPSASNYSSCDGEGSELDRYCSANSVLGSASVCSSVGNYGDLLDFSDSPVCDRINRTLDEGGVASPREWGSSNRMGSFSGMRTPSRLHPAYVNRLGESARLGEVEGQQDGLSVGRDDGCSGQMSLLPTTANAEEFGRAVIDVDAGTSNRDELSEGEDSMLDYGTDCENSTGQHAKRNFKYIEGMKCEDVNPLLMNSSVAFGSDDLDEFLQENGGFDLHYPSLDQDQSALLQFVPAKDEKNVPSLANNRVIELHNAVEEKEIVADVSVASVQAQITDQPDQSVRASPIRNPLDAYGDSDKEMSLTVEHPMEDQIKHMLKGIEGGIYSLDDGIIVDVDVHEAAEKQVFGELVPVDHAINEIFFSFSAGASQSEQSYSQEHDKPRSSLPVLPNSQSSSFQIELNKNSKISDLTEEDVVTDENKKQNTGDAYEEMVLEMEEILLDNGTSNGTRFGANLGYLNHQGYRDGSSTASTSGTDEVYPPAQYPTASRIDWVEVIGAKQRTGDVSFGERLIGVKEYTVYILRVWSANDQWEVERRYRDFCSLYQQLKTLFSEHGLSLPSEWVFAERESMNFFGNASPIVVSKRSSLIQDCLRSVLNSRYPFGFPSPLLSFLSPGKVASNSSLLKAIVPQSLQKIGEGWNIKFLTHGGSSEDVSELGKTISLVVDIKPHKSMQQLLELQHYTCAGCHKNLDAGKTLFGELVQTLGWKKPRLCEYTGQLFCASCHTNDTSVLPAKVLHLWDFSVYPVSQLAKAYLESIYDKPMLCVSAMNPFLFSKVPALLHVMGIRKKIAAMVPYIRCPFRISVQRGLGSRRHLLESNDFFALRDLVDLSKGAFAALPIMLETVSNKILEHITQQCLVCYDTGVPCAARQVCDEPLSLIFPFQEAETARCGSCGSVFHKSCFIKIINCPCRKPTSEVRNRGKDHGHSQELLDEHGEPSESSSTSNLFSNILTIARPDRIWKTRGRNPVILMGSLPNSTL